MRSPLTHASSSSFNGIVLAVLSEAGCILAAGCSPFVSCGLPVSPGCSSSVSCGLPVSSGCSSSVSCGLPVSPGCSSFVSCGLPVSPGCSSSVSCGLPVSPGCSSSVSCGLPVSSGCSFILVSPDCSTTICSVCPPPVGSAAAALMLLNPRTRTINRAAVRFFITTFPPTKNFSAFTHRRF